MFGGDKLVYLKYSVSEKSDGKSLHIIAKNALNELLKSAFGIENALPLIKTHRGGKPYIEGANFDFSDSHTENAIAVAACGEGGAVPGLICIDENFSKIGVDIEWAERKTADKSMIKVIDKLYTAEEKNYVDIGAAGYKKRFLEIWTKKESIVKATGEGLSGVKKADTNNFPCVFLKTEYVNIGDKEYIISIAGI